GNSDPNQRHQYPDSNDTDGVQDPAQAWNAITVGACTSRVLFDQSQFPGYEPIASVGDLTCIAHRVIRGASSLYCSVGKEAKAASDLVNRCRGAAASSKARFFCRSARTRPSGSHPLPCGT
ncbi:MAG TPA: S8 family serine peptidase, partial [Pirellulales bacterium]|nr:S8 family serine peptidase [Pirellulales bacterium]